MKYRITMLIIAIVLMGVLFFINKPVSNQNIKPDTDDLGDIPEHIYTQDCMPRTLLERGVSIKCFEHANIGDNEFCNSIELKKIKDYYEKDEQNTDQYNDGSGKFCAR